MSPDLNAPSTALALVQPSAFPVVASDSAGLDAIQTVADMGGGTFDLERLKVPSGGDTFWKVPDERGEIQAVKSINAVIVCTHSKLKAWWKIRYGSEGSGNTPPDCSSTDGVTGFGVRDVAAKPDAARTRAACKDCRFNQFGSQRKDGAFGKGKDCGDFAHMFFYREGMFLPTMVKVPVMSLAPVKEYAMLLAGRGRQPETVLTSISLNPAVSDGGQPYAVMAFRIAALLDDASAARFKALRERLEATILARAAIDPASFAEPADVEHTTVSSTPSTPAAT